MCCILFWNTQLQKSKGYALAEEKLLNHLIPGLLQGFVQGKQIHRRTSSAEQTRMVIPEIQNQSAYIIDRKGTAGLFQKLSGVFPGKLEDEVKS